MLPNPFATMLLTTDKAELRRQMLTARAAVPKDMRKAQSREIAARVFAERSFQDAKTVFCYCSYGDEIDTYDILHAALAAGKTVCLPRTLGGGQMQARAVRSLDALQMSKYGILEPGEDCALVDPAQLDLCIIPCLAADVTGRRLGYGGGYYDRYLPQTPAVRMVLCAGARLFAQIPAQEHDIACNMILTEGQVVRLHEA